MQAADLPKRRIDALGSKEHPHVRVAKVAIVAGPHHLAHLAAHDQARGGVLDANANVGAPDVRRAVDRISRREAYEKRTRSVREASR